MNYFKIEAELKASIREMSGGEVRFRFRTDPNWRFEDIRENGGLLFIKRIEYETDEITDEVEEYQCFVSMDRTSRTCCGNVLKGIFVEMIYDHLRTLDRYHSPMRDHMVHMIYVPDTSGFFNRHTFDKILRGPWFREQVSLTGSMETVLEDGTTLSIRFGDTDICTVCRDGEPEDRIRLTCSSLAERRKGKKPMEEQMEFAYPAYGDVLNYGKTVLEGPFMQPWYTGRYHWAHTCAGIDPDSDSWGKMDWIDGVDSLSDILEAIRLYDKYHDKEGRSGLMTEKIEKALLAVDEGELARTPKADWNVIVMYFDPCNLFNQWLIVSGRKCDGDWELYGLVHLLEWEWGCVSLRQLEEAANRPGDHPACRRILREVSVSGQRLEDVLKSHHGRSGWEELI